MRLLNTRTIKLHSFHGDDDIPRYAILSHTWGNAEVSFYDLSVKGAAKLKYSEGYSKIRSCCALAVQEGYDYVWIDTCCIDKTSSAELSEAINSMYRWYQKAQICYAYLADVCKIDKGPWSLDGGLQFRESRWFTRGWTLQELLAPKRVVFYGNDWQEFGPKSSLQAQLSLITGIQPHHLYDISGASVAQKMSWASGRKTKRVEDIAYSLMGIFDVNMPLLYGEGKKAFMRLQHEIVKISDDESIFAWTDSELAESGIFAQSPRVYEGSGNVVQLPSIHPLYVRRDPYTVTNKGLAIPNIVLERKSASSTSDSSLSSMLLNCGLQSKPGVFPSHQLVIDLQSISQDDYVRAWPGELKSWSIPTDVSGGRLIYIRPIYVSRFEEDHSFLIRNISSKGGQFSMPEAYGCRLNKHIRELPHDEGQWEFTLEKGQTCAAVLVVPAGSFHKSLARSFGLIFRATTSAVGIDSIVLFNKFTFQREVVEYKYSLGNRPPQDSRLRINLGDRTYASVFLQEDGVRADRRSRCHQIEIDIECTISDLFF